jgi:hypothetical protein
MNTRGLMELVILTIGLDLGVISPALFAMLDAAPRMDLPAPYVTA